MGAFHRGEVRYVNDIDVPSQAFWDVFTDWASTDWLPVEPDKRPLPIAECVLAPGQRPDDVPLTRIVTIAPPGQSSYELRETLIYKDPEAWYLRYTVDGIGPGGMRNYLAQLWLDELAPERTRVNWLGRFDVAEQAAVEELQKFLSGFYAFAVAGMVEAEKRR